MKALFEKPEARRRFFALGNLLPALVLGGGCSLLPVRWWPMDVTVGLGVVGLLVTSGLALFDAHRGDRALRFAAAGLLAIGLVLVAAFALSMAFLVGVQGPFGAGGAALMGLVVLLLLPYAVVYPALELWLFRGLDTATTPVPRAEAPVEPVAETAEVAERPDPALDTEAGS